MKKFIFYFSIICLTILQTAWSSNDKIDLSGKWQVKLTESARRDSLFVPQRGLRPTQNIMYSPTILAANAKTEGVIDLPGTLDEGGFGNPVLEADLGCLSRKVRFIGEAIYTRNFTTTQTADWDLTLERVMWKSVVKIDGNTIGTQESLGTPHKFIIKNLKSGRHTIEIIVDNTMIHRIGEKGHAYGEHMQTIWNGILGEIALNKIATPQLEKVRIHAPYTAEKVEMAFFTSSPSQKYVMVLRDNNTKKEIVKHRATKRIDGNQTFLSLSLEGKNITVWDEFNPKLYELELLANGASVYKTTIGFRSFKREGNKLFMNGKPLFLRGNIDNCHFPLTGYPSMKKDDWIRIFKISKNLGCNNIRFHSYCPPRAAFEAADEVGLYLAPEAEMWIDGWMPAKIVAIGCGNNDMDNYVRNEMSAIVNAYGNHASFAMFGIGNELGNSNFEVMEQWVANLKTENMQGFSETENYKNRLYSVSTARKVTAADDYNITHHSPGVGGVRQQMYPRTNWDYENLYSKTAVPTIAHEIGQWPVYPDWNEIQKYTGVLRPWNLENLRDNAKSNGVFQYNKQFQFASAMQNRMMYKDEIESFMRTQSCAGIHLLGMQDYSGQGEALIGFLNSFYEEKGFWHANEVRGCFAPLVTLAEFEKYGWKTSETFLAKIMFRNQKEDLRNCKIRFVFTDKNGSEIKSGFSEIVNSKNGEVTPVGEISLPLNNLGYNKITLSTILYNEKNEAISDTNTWSFWTFEDEAPIDINPRDIMVTDNLQDAVDALNLGKKVLLDASALGKKGTFLKGNWGAVYWSTTWFPGQAMQTLGLWLQKEHPIFNNFSCEGFGDWIWWKICAKGRAFIINDLAADYTPIAMPVPDFHNNQRLGGIFEVAVKRGKLLVSGYKIDGQTIEQKVYRNALINYMKSESFSPKTMATTEWLYKIFDTGNKEKIALPDEFQNALLYIECAVNNGVDRYFSVPQISYETKNFNIKGNKWNVSDNAQLIIKTPAGELGLLHIKYSGSGAGSIEGRNFDLPNAQSASVSLNIDREDCLDGKLILNLQTQNNLPLAIERIIFIPANKK